MKKLFEYLTINVEVVEIFVELQTFSFKIVDIFIKFRIINFFRYISYLFYYI